jgi:hypothetical protein
MIEGRHGNVCGASKSLTLHNTGDIADVAFASIACIVHGSGYFVRIFRVSGARQPADG